MPARSHVVAGAEQQPLWRCEYVLVDPFAQHRDEHGWDRHAAGSGLGFAGFIEGDVGFGDVEPSPSVGGQYGWEWHGA